MAETAITPAHDMNALIKEIAAIVFTDDQAKDTQKFLEFVNQDPFPSWVKYNEQSKTNYIPVGILETLMQRLF